MVESTHTAVKFNSESTSSHALLRLSEHDTRADNLRASGNEHFKACRLDEALKASDAASPMNMLQGIRQC
jgi:hypothetical protein